MSTEPLLPHVTVEVDSPSTVALPLSPIAVDNMNNNKQPNRCGELPQIARLGFGGPHDDASSSEETGSDVECCNVDGDDNQSCCGSLSSTPSRFDFYLASFQGRELGSGSTASVRLATIPPAASSPSSPPAPQNPPLTCAVKMLRPSRHNNLHFWREVEALRLLENVPLVIKLHHSSPATASDGPKAINLLFLENCSRGELVRPDKLLARCAPQQLRASFAR